MLLKPLMLWHELQGLWRQREHTLPLLLEVPHLWQTHIMKRLFFVSVGFLSVSCARCKSPVWLCWGEEFHLAAFQVPICILPGDEGEFENERRGVGTSKVAYHHEALMLYNFPIQ